MGIGNVIRTTERITASLAEEKEEEEGVEWEVWLYTWGAKMY